MTGLTGWFRAVATPQVTLNCTVPQRQKPSHGKDMRVMDHWFGTNIQVHEPGRGTAADPAFVVGCRAWAPGGGN